MIDKDHNKTNTGGVQATKVTSIYLNPMVASNITHTDKENGVWFVIHVCRTKRIG